VALVGSVRQEAIYELRGEETIEELLEASGGRTAVASGGRISVERIEDHAQRRAFELKTDAAGLATPLDDGDIVRINPIASDYRETVTLRGSVANPGRFLWHVGMKLSDLMPDRDSLVSRDYWWRRTSSAFRRRSLCPPSTPLLRSRRQADFQRSRPAALPCSKAADFQCGKRAAFQTLFPTRFCSSNLQTTIHPRPCESSQTPAPRQSGHAGRH